MSAIAVTSRMAPHPNPLPACAGRGGRGSAFASFGHEWRGNVGSVPSPRLRGEDSGEGPYAWLR
jgi:hypothetical protein